MDQIKLDNLIRENKGILRQLTSLNNEVKELKGKVKKLEQQNSCYPNAEEIKRMPIYEGCDS